MHFVYLEGLTMLANDTINNFSIIPNIVLYYLFIKYLCISKISLVLIA